MEDVDILRHDAARIRLFFEMGDHFMHDIRLKSIEAVAKLFSPRIKEIGFVAERIERQDIFDAAPMKRLRISPIATAEIFDPRERRHACPRKYDDIFDLCMNRFEGFTE